MRDISENRAGQLAKGALQKVPFKWMVISLFLVVGFFGAVYTVEEGHVGIVKRFSKAERMETPGIHLKFPFVEKVVLMEVRTRKNQENNLSVATSEQMPSTAAVSVNWNVPEAEALNIYKKYGGLDQYEQRILDPRLRAAAKTAISQFTAEKLIVNRALAVTSIHENLTKELEGHLINFDSVQLVEITFPKRYMDAVKAKQVELQRSQEEAHKLERQRLVAQQEVNTAEAKRDAEKARADGKAYRIKTEADAQAQAILATGNAKAEAAQALANAIAGQPLVVEFERVKQWTGQVPTTMLGGAGGGTGTNVLLGMPLQGMHQAQR